MTSVIAMFFMLSLATIVLARIIVFQPMSLNLLSANDQKSYYSYDRIIIQLCGKSATIRIWPADQQTYGKMANILNRKGW